MWAESLEKIVYGRNLEIPPEMFHAQIDSLICGIAKSIANDHKKTDFIDMGQDELRAELEKRYAGLFAPGANSPDNWVLFPHTCGVQKVSRCAASGSMGHFLGSCENAHLQNGNNHNDCWSYPGNGLFRQTVGYTTPHASLISLSRHTACGKGMYK